MSNPDNLIHGRAMDVFLPSGCRGCAEANFELNTCRALANVALTVDLTNSINKASAQLISYLELRCSGLTDEYDKHSCPMPVKDMSFANHFKLPAPPTDIVDY